MAIRNRISDLNDYLFEALDVLSNEDLSEEELKKEIRRASAISAISANIIDVARTQLSAAKIQMEYGDGKSQVLPAMLTYEHK